MAVLTYHRGAEEIANAFIGDRLTRADATTIRVGDPVSSTTFGGTFAYDGFGRPRGTIETLTVVSDRTLLLRATGLDADIGTIVAVADDSAAIDALLFAGADRINGSRFDDFLLGLGGNDKLLGGAGDDTLSGGSGDDRLSGGDGRDILNGGRGSDLLAGGAGNDVYVIESYRDLFSYAPRLVERADEGIDLVASFLGVTLGANFEQIELLGTYRVNAVGNSLANRIEGNDAANAMRGLAGDDLILGRGGEDTILGGEGADRIEGGTGRDLLLGDAGADVFVFRAPAEAGLGRGRDILRDFRSGSDILHLAAIDADAARPGDQAFVWIGGDSFSGTAGELRLVGRVIEGDVDGDARADLQLAVLGPFGIQQTDILL